MHTKKASLYRLKANNTYLFIYDDNITPARSICGPSFELVLLRKTHEIYALRLEKH